MKKTPKPGDRIVWALGRAAESHVRNQFISARQYHGILGNWSCPCGLVRSGYHNPQEVCDRCGASASIYGELTLRDSELPLIGNPDLLFTTVSGAIRVVEIKSLNQREFIQLHKPKPDHVLQAWLYVRLIQRNPHLVGMRSADETPLIVYVCKDYAFTPYKEFQAPWSESIETSLTLALKKVADVLAWSREETTLPRKLQVCQTQESPTAKQCPLCARCFAHD